MNPYIVTIIILGLYMAGVLLVILIGQLFTRSDMYRQLARKHGKQYPPSRILEDLRPVQQTMIEFIAASPPSRELLRRLAERNDPIPVRSLLANTAASASSWSALFLIALAGLVRLRRHGASITSVGHEVLARLGAGTTARAQETLEVLDTGSELSKNSLLPVQANGKKEVSSHSRLVTEVTDRRTPGLFPVPARSIRAPQTDQHGAQRLVLVRNNAENSSRAIVTAADYRELASAIVAARKLAVHEPETRILQEKLAHAAISIRSDLPPDVITLYSRAELIDLETDERLNLMLVFPIDARLENGRASVFDPLGVAMLGRRVGDELRWAVPYGVRRFEVKAVHFQPETALAEAA